MIITVDLGSWLHVVAVASAVGCGWYTGRAAYTMLIDGLTWIANWLGRKIR